MKYRYRVLALLSTLSVITYLDGYAYRWRARASKANSTWGRSNEVLSRARLPSHTRCSRYQIALATRGWSGFHMAP
jgi:hypothetical protein